VPAGAAWLHEPKLDDYRLVKARRDVRLLPGVVGGCAVKPPAVAIGAFVR
jgi:hypothetical protein